MTKEECRAKLHKLVDVIENDSTLRRYYLMMEYGYTRETEEAQNGKDKNII